MGVPGFFLWLTKNYKKDGFVFQKEKLVEFVNKKKLDDEEIIKKKEYEHFLTEVNSVDYFLIDANSLIHPVCFKVIAENQDLKDNDILENKMINEVINYLEKIINYVNPSKGVYIAIDGVAPLAKIKQQRSRRFKSIADKQMFDNIKRKHSKEITNHWNNNAITPGTLFMIKLHNRITEWSNNSIIYSSCFTPAEGEHKLLQFIRKNQKNNKNYSYTIYGLDADLIFLALSTHSNNIYLLREATEFNKNEEINTFNYVSINIMRQSIVQTVKNYLIKEENENLYGFYNSLDNTRIINDFIFMCYFLGNDFLPHMPSLDIHQNGIENLIINYAKTMNDLIIKDNYINYLIDVDHQISDKYFNNFINKLANEEETILKQYYSKKKKLRYIGDGYEKEIFKIENLQFKINDPIQLGSDNMEEWRKRYYKYYWDVDENELEHFSKLLVKHYLYGIKWITIYYFDDCPSWEWYYPFDHPPFISDIANYYNDIDINNFKFNLGKPLKPFMQLLSVLPPQSSYLLPESFRKLVLNPKSSICFMYPIKFEQDFINKKKYWMAIPKLPPLDIEQIKHSYNKYKNELKPDEIKRNKFINE